MRRARIGIIACLMAIALVLVGCSVDFSKTTSPEQLRQLLADAQGVSIEQPEETPTATKPAKKIPPIPDLGTQEEYDGPYLGYLPDYYYGEYGPYRKELNAAQKRGLQTWYFWNGGNGTFFREMSRRTGGEIDFLSLLDSRPKGDSSDPGHNHFARGERFKETGLVNDPGCEPATEPDEYGFWMDNCDKDPHSAGVMGARKFRNPDFEPAKWDVNKYYQEGAKIEPPYLVGISCGICHIAFNPNNPPKDPEHPTWKNITGALGNQYIREGQLFGWRIPDDDFRGQLLDSQPPGTSDTSRLGADFIDNPNPINAIFNLEDRLELAENSPAEVMNDGSKRHVPHVLKDGADSIGVAGATERVYVNIGECSDYWLTLHDPIYGRTPQKPFRIKEAQKPEVCKGDYWNKTSKRVADAAEYLKTVKPYHLEDAPGGEKYLTQDESVLEKGKIAFAANCAQCHSSKQPPAEIEPDSEEAKEWYRQSVLSSDFRDHNFLSTDARKPVTEIGTNAVRALATNATEGHLWEELSSRTYKELPSPGTLENLYNPIESNKPIDLKIPDGGLGYYRVPSLISIWSSAPFMSNNLLGEYTGDPSVEGRMKAFNASVEQLLWPEKRKPFIKRTKKESKLILPLEPGLNLEESKKIEFTVPKNTPIKLVANQSTQILGKLDSPKLREYLDKNTLLPSSVKKALVDKIIQLTEAKGDLLIDLPFFRRVVAKVLLELNTAPDFVENRGHLFGTDLPDQDKKALIEFLKTL